MTMILKTPEDKIIIYCKGADSILWPLMKNTEYKEATEKNIQVISISFLTISKGICR
jgi:virulence-associated protein VagC